MGFPRATSTSVTAIEAPGELATRGNRERTAASANSGSMGSFCVSLRIAEKSSLQGPAAVTIDNLVSSSEQLFHDARFLLDSRQALIEPLKSIGKLGMIETEEMQDRRMQITNVNTVLDHVEAEVVRSAKSHASALPTFRRSAVNPGVAPPDAHRPQGACLARMRQHPQSSVTGR